MEDPSAVEQYLKNALGLNLPNSSASVGALGIQESLGAAATPAPPGLVPAGDGQPQDPAVGGGRRPPPRPAVGGQTGLWGGELPTVTSTGVSPWGCAPPPVPTAPRAPPAAPVLGEQQLAALRHESAAISMHLVQLSSAHSALTRAQGQGPLSPEQQQQLSAIVHRDRVLRQRLALINNDLHVARLQPIGPQPPPMPPPGPHVVAPSGRPLAAASAPNGGPISAYGNDALSRDMVGMYATIAPPQEDWYQRQQVVSLVTSLVDGIWKGARVEMFGSSASGLHKRGADLDLCLLPPRQPHINAQRRMVENLGAALKRRGMMEVLPLPNARVPIVKFVDRASRLKCDVCINNILALYNTRLLAAYCSIDARVKLLVMTIKMWASNRNINEPYHVRPSTRPPHPPGHSNLTRPWRTLAGHPKLLRLRAPRHQLLAAV